MTATIGRNVSMAICLLAFALFNTTNVLADDEQKGKEAAHHLKIVVEGKCEYFDYDKYVVINTNDKKRILATITTSGDIQSHKYLDKNGVEKEDSYPKKRDYLLSPQSHQMIGCAIANWRVVKINQTFSVTDAKYVRDNFTLPDKDEAADYFRVYLMTGNNDFNCSGRGDKFVWFANAHPYKSFTADIKITNPDTLVRIPSMPAMVSRNYDCIGNPPRKFSVESASFLPDSLKILPDSLKTSKVKPVSEP